MAKLENLEGVGILLLAILFNAVFALHVIARPDPHATPRILAVLPAITVTVGR